MRDHLDVPPARWDANIYTLAYVTERAQKIFAEIGCHLCPWCDDAGSERYAARRTRSAKGAV